MAKREKQSQDFSLTPTTTPSKTVHAALTVLKRDTKEVAGFFILVRHTDGHDKSFYFGIKSDSTKSFTDV